MTDKQFYKLLVWIMGIYIVIMVLMAATCKADDGLTTILDNEYKTLTIPETRWVLITEEKAWHAICLFHFPDRNPKKLLGIAIQQKDKIGKISYIILMPLFQGAYDGSFLLMELVLGHEFMHIADFYLGTYVFDPDRREKEEWDRKNQ